MLRVLCVCIKKCYSKNNNMENKKPFVCPGILGEAHAEEIKGMGLIYEDELPEDMTQEEYDEWYKTSSIVYGVRMGQPFVRKHATGGIIKSVSNFFTGETSLKEIFGK